ncbi:hypothetical protein P8452_65741 [Trifolium repens]|nr:hypothetical protein P8452_65741 [Trifolium repens]
MGRFLSSEQINSEQIHVFADSALLMRLTRNYFQRGKILQSSINNLRFSHEFLSDVFEECVMRKAKVGMKEYQLGKFTSDQSLYNVLSKWEMQLVSLKLD